MSTASQSCTLTRIKNGMNYSGMLTVNKGDLWEKYNATKVSPDRSIATNQPVVTFQCYTGEGSVPDTIAIYWDDVAVPFASLNTGSLNTASSNLAAGVIKIEQKGDKATGKKWMIRFVKNIAVAGTAVLPSHTLRIVGTFASGNKVVGIKGYSLSELIDSGESVHIEPGPTDANPFVVDQNVANSKCTLVAQVDQGGEPVSLSGCTYKWFRQDAASSTGWSVVSGQTGQTLDVTASMVEAYAMFKVEVTVPSGNTVADTQSVMDVGDPYEVAINVYNQSGAASEPNMNGDVSTSEARWFTASLVSRRGGTPPTIQACYWLVTSVDGVTQNAGGSKIGDMVGSTMNTANLTGSDKNTIKILASWLDGLGLQSVDVTAMVTF